MNDYMRALHQRFFRETDFVELEQELEQTRREVQACLDTMQWHKLMRLVDIHNMLREEVSLASFTAGFRLGLGIAGELKHYSFEDHEEDRARKTMEMKVR